MPWKKHRYVYLKMPQFSAESVLKNSGFPKGIDVFTHVVSGRNTSSRWEIFTCSNNNNNNNNNNNKSPIWGDSRSHYVSVPNIGKRTVHQTTWYSVYSTTLQYV
jgi:hypothetical protein